MAGMTVDIKDRFERNIGAITQSEQELLLSKRVAVIGCGGLGGYTAELLVRIGVGHLTLFDGDAFTASNLNRQLNALETNLGKSKVLEAKERLLQIRSDLSVAAYACFLDEKNTGELLKGHDVIIDALDSAQTRLLIEKITNDLAIPLIHGAVEEWGAQVCAVFPGDFTLSRLYQANQEPGKPSVVSFTPAFCASLEAAEAVKVLLNKGNILRKKLLTVDIKNCSFDIIEL